MKKEQRWLEHMKQSLRQPEEGPNHFSHLEQDKKRQPCFKVKKRAVTSINVIIEVISDLLVDMSKESTN